MSYPVPITSDINSVAVPMISDDDIPSLKSKLLKEFLDVLDDQGPLKPMIGPLMSIELVQGYKPLALSNARPIPIAWRDTVKKILEDVTAQGIIALELILNVRLAYSLCPVTPTCALCPISIHYTLYTFLPSYTSLPGPSPLYRCTPRLPRVM